MPLVDNLYVVALQCQFEQCHHPVIHELSGYGTTAEAGKLLCYKPNVLCGLHYADLIPTSFRLDRYDMVAALLIEANIQFIDLDLAYSLYSGA